MKTWKMMTPLMHTRIGFLICMKGDRPWVSYMLLLSTIDDFICNVLMTNKSIIIFSELGDRTREETVETYKQWLRLEGKLDEISNIFLPIQ